MHQIQIRTMSCLFAKNTVDKPSKNHMIHMRYTLPHDLFQNMDKIGSFDVEIVSFKSIFQLKILSQYWHVWLATFVNKALLTILLQLTKHWINWNCLKDLCGRYSWLLLRYSNYCFEVTILVFFLAFSV